MSKFIETQSRRLCEEVDKYAQKLGFLEKPSRDSEGETIPGGSVPVEMSDLHGDRRLVFSTDGAQAAVVISEKELVYTEDACIIFPCGRHISNLVKCTAQTVVHSIFDPD